MTLSDILTELQFLYTVDRRCDKTVYSTEKVTSVEIVEASTATDTLTIALYRKNSESPLAVLTATGRFYILRAGIDGVIIVQGPDLSESQQTKLATLAEFYRDNFDRAIDGYSTTPVKKAKTSKKSDATETTSEPVFEVSGSDIDKVDATEPE